MTQWHSIPLTLTSSGEIDRPSYGSGTLERAGVKLSANVQMTHLKQKGKEKAVGTEILVLNDPLTDSLPSHLVRPDAGRVEVGVSSCWV